jgi:hypothetical protein
MALWLEGLSSESAKIVEEEKRKQAAAGIKPITFTGAQAQEYLKKANDAGWGALVKRSPEHGAKLRALMTKP